jgi:protein YibB
MNLISIVTAFYDIGRGDWKPSMGLPHYLERSVDTYMERFSHLCDLDNELVVFTSSDLVDRVNEIFRKKNKQNATVVSYDLDRFSFIREVIVDIQTSDDFQSKVNPSQKLNPEYWNADYVLVTNLKAHFVSTAIRNDMVKGDMVAWIDFGYCRSNQNIPPSKVWTYEFDNRKIHMFNYKDYKGEPIEQIIFNNDVYILGAKVVAHRSKWSYLEHLMTLSRDKLAKSNMVDDDQGLWLMSYIFSPEDFELHRIPDHQLGYDPFVLFKEFNDTV